MFKPKSIAYAIALICGVSATAVSAQESAASFPSKPITIIVASGAGGSSDVETRLYADKLSLALGQPVIVENKAGAGGTVGNTFVAHAPPDGYTLLATSPTITITPAVRADAPYHPLTDFEPIVLMSSSPTVLVVRADMPVNTAQEYIQYAKDNPGKITFGASGGIGGMNHLSGAWLHGATHTKATFVAYQGGPQAMVDMLEGRLDATMTSINFMKPYIAEGQVKALAVASLERVASLPDVPTIAELGIVPGYDAVFWLGYLAPKGTPPDIIAKLNAAFVKISKSPDIVARLEAQTQVPIGNTPQEFKTVMEQEVARWQKVVTDSGITLE